MKGCKSLQPFFVIFVRRVSEAEAVIDKNHMDSVFMS